MRLHRTAGFWLVAFTFFVLTGAAGAPTPLYIVYQAEWDLSAITLTTIFAVYVLALLLTLVTFGGVSDFVGRRPVLMAALGLEVLSMLSFLAADSVAFLVLARVIQGVAVGLAMGAVSAALVDLAPPGSPKTAALVNSTVPTLGLALGALGSAALVQYAPSPTSLVFIVFIVLFVVLGGASVVVPETVQKRAGAVASLRPHVAIPAVARGQFAVALPTIIATWAIGGLYLSLGPSLVTGVLEQQNHLVGGFGVATLMLAGTAASLLVRDIDPRQVMTVGSGVLAVGTVVTLTGLETGSLAVFFVGTAVAGAGFGSAFLGAFRSLAGLAAPAERAELFSALYVVSYLAFSIPAVVAGFCVPHLGLLDTALGYGVGVVTLAVAATVLQPLRARSAARALAPEPG